MPLCSLPGHSEAVSEVLGPQKPLKTKSVFEVFVDAQFLALARSCWRYWAHPGALGPILSSNWLPKLPQNWSKFGPKSNPKLVPFLVLFLDQFLQILRIPRVARGVAYSLSGGVPRAASRAVLITN